MKKYECLYIVNINFDSEGISAVVARVEEVLKNVGGELVNTQHWGKRKLAYAIDKERYGNYILMHFQGEDPDVSELTRNFEIESGVLHYMTIRLDDFPDFETLTVPQAFEAERGKRPGGRDGRDSRRPRRTDETETPADETAEAPESTEAPADTPVEAAVEETTTEAPLEEATDETATEEVVEEAVEETEAEEVVEEAVTEAPEPKAEEPADETPEEDAEKPADAE